MRRYARASLSHQTEGSSVAEMYSSESNTWAYCLGQTINLHTMTVDDAANFHKGKDEKRSSVTRQDDYLACQTTIYVHT